jgi:hypothetical protein
MPSLRQWWHEVNGMVQVKESPASATTRERMMWRLVSVLFGAFVCLSLLWLLWTQHEQNQQLSAMTQHLHYQSTTITGMNDQLRQFIRDSATAANNAAPTIVDPPGGSAITSPPTTGGTTDPNAGTPSVTTPAPTPTPTPAPGTATGTGAAGAPAGPDTTTNP